jgi:hypothetical protein
MFYMSVARTVHERSFTPVSAARTVYERWCTPESIARTLVSGSRTVYG